MGLEGFAPVPGNKDVVTNSEVSPELLAEMDGYVAHKDLERKERTEAAVSIGFDRTVIACAIERAGDDENAKELLGRFRRLPEQLVFEPGLTLVVGDNGSGKTTLTKAVWLAINKYIQAEDIKINLLGKGFGSYSYRDLDPAERAKRFLNASSEAEQDVFNPRQDYERLWLVHSGLAPVIAKAMTMRDYFSSQDYVPNYADFTTVSAESRQGDASHLLAQHTSLRLPGEDDPIESGRDSSLKLSALRAKEAGSAFQERMRRAKNIVHGERLNYKKGPAVFVLDEPETGASPWNQSKIEQTIANIVDTEAHPNSIVLTSTNSRALYEKDLPRIDMRYPERGIFRPSEYPGYFDEE